MSSSHCGLSDAHSRTFFGRQTVGTRMVGTRMVSVRREWKPLPEATVSRFAVVRGASGPGAGRWAGEFARLFLVLHVLVASAHVLVPGPAHAAGIAPSEAGARVPKPDGDSVERGTSEVVAGPDRAIADRRPPSGSGVEIRKRIRAEHVAASLRRAYSALLAGDAETAAETYRQVLGHETHNRDALLGLAAVAARAGRWSEATEFYARVLALHPADPVAQDRPRRVWRVGRGARRETPEGAPAARAAGRLHALRARQPVRRPVAWTEARLSYANARRFDGANPDYTYNLAVSLDHLLERGGALDLYREALALANGRSASFETEVVVARIRAMEAAPDTGEFPAQIPPQPDAGRSTGTVR